MTRRWYPPVVCGLLSSPQGSATSITAKSAPSPGDALTATDIEPTEISKWDPA
ncbi:hypothetical protein I552_7859 [Mycobacterium xenopi 3993]|nr:hypothetical protein I552_7859 [Mycobacterium xenopi 3993]